MKRNININLAVIFISVCIICVMLATHCAHDGTTYTAHWVKEAK